MTKKVTKGCCPKCGTALKRSKFIEGWDTKGKISETSTDWECPKCKVRWVAFIINESARLKPA